TAIRPKGPAAWPIDRARPNADGGGPMKQGVVLAGGLLLAGASRALESVDVLIRGGTGYDGPGPPGRAGDGGLAAGPSAAGGKPDEGERDARRRGEGAGGRARLHQHAELVHRVAPG